MDGTNILELASAVPRLRIVGERNSVTVGESAKISAVIEIVGDGHTLEIGPYTTLDGFISISNGNGSVVRIGHDTTMNAGTALHVWEGKSLVIGDDCMISTLVFAATSDMHPIYDATLGERINAAEDIVIGDRVWVGRMACLNKGSRVGSGSVIACGAIVTGKIPEGVIAAGTPARVVREGVRWARDMPI